MKRTLLRLGLSLFLGSAITSALPSVAAASSPQVLSDWGNAPGKRPMVIQTGSKPWLFILLRFADNPAEPREPDYYRRLLTGAQGLDQYWREVSNGKINLEGSRVVGWYALPHPRSYYIDQGRFLSHRALEDAVLLVDPIVYFPDYVGLSFVFNDYLGDRDVDRATAFGGPRSGYLDGVPGTWGITWIPANLINWVFGREVSPTHSVFAHEMGHALGLPHSTGPYGFNYDNFWDVMSYWGFLVKDPEFGILGTHTIAYHKDMLGWLSAEEKEEVPPGVQVTRRLERIALPVKSGLSMVKLPWPGSGGRFYTLEYRQRSGFDRGLVDDGAVIHDIDPGRWEVNINWGVPEWHPAHVADGDGNGNTGDEGAVWKPGEIFVDEQQGIRVRVESADESAVTLTANNNALFFADYVAGAEIWSKLMLLNASPQFPVSGTVNAWRSDGQAWPIAADGPTEPEKWSFELPPRGVLFRKTETAAEVSTGWLQAGSDRPVDGSVLFSSPWGLAAVPASPLSLSSILVPIVQDPASATRSGVAVSNPNSEPVELTVQLRTGAGEAVPGGVGTIRLPARGQKVQFADELVPAISGQAFVGTIDISGALPVDAVAIQSSRTGYATLPVVPKSRRRGPGPVAEVSTFAGRARLSGTADGALSDALLSSPSDVVFDSSGMIYIADSGNHAIRRVDTATGQVRTFAGLAGVAGSADGPAEVARFNEPRALAIDSAGNLLVADWGNHTIRRITPSGQVSTVAGKAGEAGAADGVGTSAQLNHPTGIAVDKSGVVYVSDSENHLIRRLGADGALTTLAGTAGKAGQANGQGATARFNLPQKIAIDAAGNLLIAEYRSARIRKVTPEGVASSFAGRPGLPGLKDGTAQTAQFYIPTGIAVAPSGIVYVADACGIRRIGTDGQVTTIAGYSQPPTSSDSPCGIDDGSGIAARFCYTRSVRVGAGESVFIADTQNHTIRKLVLKYENQRSYFPQFAFGEGIRTTLVLVNPSETEPATGRVILRDNQGARLEGGFTGQPPGTELEFALPPLGVRFLEARATGTPVVGSATVHSTAALSGAVLFSGELGFAGVSGSRPGRRITTPVESVLASRQSTGLALFNPNDSTATVTLSLYKEEGILAASREITLAPGGQIARFPEELFAERASEIRDFRGSFEASCDLPIAGIGIQVVPGEIATLPVARTE